MTSEMLPCANSDKMHATTTKVSSDLSMTFIQFLKGMPEIHKPLRVILCISLLVCSAASTALIPKMMGRLIDSKEDRSQLEKELYIFFGVVAFNFVALAAREFSSRLLSEKIIKELRIRVFSCFVEADMEFFDRNGVGNLIGKLSNDVNQAESCSTDTVLEGLSNALLFLSNLALLIQISLNMSIVIILSLPLYVYITLVFSQRTKRISKKYNKVLSMSQDFME
jgi:ABC-type multidrug transport system fused ATPase/permease subunit